MADELTALRATLDAAMRSELATARERIAALEGVLTEAVAVERERIAVALDSEGDVCPCAEDAIVIRDCARLVRADFSYEDADTLADDEDAAALSSGKEQP